MMTWGGSGIIYECMRCGSQMTERDLEERGGSVKCVNCGYRVLKKTKPPVVKRIDTR